MCNPSDIQHLSVYVPDPSHVRESEQVPRDHPKSSVGLYIETSKHFELGAIKRHKIDMKQFNFSNQDFTDSFGFYHKNNSPTGYFLFV